MPNFSDYIVFADESGDHGLVSIDPEFPVFALVFCLFEKDRYVADIEPAFRRLKHEYFGHDSVILHEHDIRKQTADFAILRNAEVRDAFMRDVSELMGSVPFQGYASVIDKLALKRRYADPWNPYEIAMKFCMEKVSNRLLAHRQRGRLTHVLFEGRGRVEDAQLELEFRRVAANQRRWGWRAIDFARTPLEPVFVPKAANLAGHQFTDLIARPLALRGLRPDQANRAFDIIRAGMNDIKFFPD
jgi:hypothetical protein